MNNRFVKYAIYLAIFVVVLLISIRIQPLDKAKSSSENKVFDAHTFAQEFWQESLPEVLNAAVDIAELVPLLQSDQKAAIKKYAKSVGIGAQYAFLIKGKGTIKAFKDDGLMLSIESIPETPVVLLTDNLFSNAIRDASGLVNVSDFPSTMEFNMISAEINKIVKQNVIGPLQEQFQVSQKLDFVGAFELDETFGPGPISIVPIRINIE